MTKICLIGGIFLVGEHKRTHEADFLIKPLILSGNPQTPFAMLPDEPEEVDVSRADLSYTTNGKMDSLYKLALSQVSTPIIVSDNKIVTVN